MKKLVLLVLLAAAPFANAWAQRESPFAVYFFGSIADDRTARPSGFNPNCWESKATAGAGAFFEYTTPISVTLSSGFHYLGHHENKDACSPRLKLDTTVIPFTVGYAFALGDYIALTPKVGFAVMHVSGEFNGQSDSGNSTKPTIGLALEGRLHRHWGLRGEVNRYTGRTTLFGTGEFHHEFNVFQFGGVFRW